MGAYSVYIESTVISYYTARRTRDIIAAAHSEITCEWWETVLPRISPYISQIVLDEISRGDTDAATRRVSAVKGFPLLEVTVEISRLADAYFKALDIPEKARNDSLHLAIATLNGMDFLVSWNCAHIASARVRKIVESLNNDEGYATPTICTPEELMEVSQ